MVINTKKLKLSAVVALVAVLLAMDTNTLTEAEIVDGGLSTDGSVTENEEVLKVEDNRVDEGIVSDIDSNENESNENQTDTLGSDTAEDEIYPYESNGSGFDLEYTGFLDVHPAYMDLNSKKDLDGDGSLDRVYKKYNGDYSNSIYLYFGNGEQLLLSQQAWGFWFEVDVADFTGDGNDEIVFYQYSIGTGGTNVGVSIFEKTESGYDKMDIPYYDHEFEEENDMINLEVSLTKKSDHEVVMYQPELNDSQIIQTEYTIYEDGEIYDEMEHLLFEDTNGIVIAYSAQECNIIDSMDGTKKALELTTYLGDKWCTKQVQWVLEYENQQWIMKKVLAL